MSQRERAQEEIAALKEQLANAGQEHDQALKEIAAERERLANVIHERVASALEEAAVRENLIPQREVESGLQQLAALKERFANEVHLEADAELAGLSELLTKLAKRGPDRKNQRPLKSEDSNPSRKVDHGVFVIAIGVGLVIALFLFFGLR